MSVKATWESSDFATLRIGYLSFVFNQLSSSSRAWDEA